MTEQERQTDDDILREILEFDPKSGEQIEDKSGLKEIKRTKFEIPPEIQSAFSDYISKCGEEIRGFKESVIKVYPERLLYISESQIGMNFVMRQYRLWEPANDEDQHFPIAVAAGFERSDRTFKPSFVEMYGEPEKDRPPSERMALGFDVQVTSSGYKAVSVWLVAELRERKIDLSFDINGGFSELGFGLDRERLGATIFLQDYIVVEANLLNLLSENGSHQLTKGQSDYQFYIDEELINIKRFEKGELKDELAIPRSINREEITQTLFDPLTLEDPINAPPELDDSWHFADLMKTVGVKWERY